MKNYEHPLWGQIYDSMHGRDAADIEFYMQQAKSAKGPVLEVACGTGRIYLPMLEHGVDAWGIDISQAMLDRLAEKARQIGLTPKTARADMRDFSLPERFALIMVPFRSFLLLETPEDQLAALRRFREHLASGGRLILNFFAPDPRTLAGQNGITLFGTEFTNPATGRRVKAWQSVRDDTMNQRQTIEWTLRELDTEGQTVDTSSLSLDLRWIYRSEFELLLRNAGYSSWMVFGGFKGEPFEREDQEMVWVAYP